MNNLLLRTAETCEKASKGNPNMKRDMMVECKCTKHVDNEEKGMAEA